MAVQDRFRTFVSDQREFFDTLITEDWETYKSDQWDYSRRREVSELFKRVQPATILDIGSGCGFHDPEMAKPDFVQRVESFDYSPRSVERAEISFPHPKVRRYVQDLKSYSPSEKFDLVVSFQVFEHLDIVEEYFAFCKRATKAAGTVAIFTPNRTRLRNVLRRRKGLPEEILDPQHFKEYSIDEVNRLGTQHGLTFIEAFGQGLDGHPLLNRLSFERRLQVGSWFPKIASGICILFRNP